MHLFEEGGGRRSLWLTKGKGESVKRKAVQDGGPDLFRLRSLKLVQKNRNRSRNGGAVPTDICRGSETKAVVGRGKHKKENLGWGE